MTNGRTGGFAAVETVLTGAVAERAFPAVSAEVGSSRGPSWAFACGRLDGTTESPEATIDTVFDLASLTKPIATTTLLLEAFARGLGRELDELAAFLPAWRGTDRASVTLSDLLAHAGGLSAHLPLYRDSVGRAEFETTICHLPLEYSPRTQSVYSDLGFMLLGFVLEDRVGRPLDAQFDVLRERLRIEDLRYRPDATWRPRTAPTGLDAWRGRVLTGEVHDRNAWALGGVAAHAGLFGTAGAVGRVARAWLGAVQGTAGVLKAPTDLVRRFATRRADIPGSSRALGWDTMLPTSSCGTRMSPTAFGHTGFTGTSLWIDPERDHYFVLLTNRVHPTDDNQAILTVRPRFHDAAVAAIDAKR